MHTVRSILLDDEERAAISDAQILIGIAYPRAADPLTPAGAGVPDDDPHRRVLAGISQAWDPITRSRLLLATETLTALRDAVAAQSDRTYWTSRVPDRVLSATEELMTTALVEERTRQVRLVQAALDVVTDALARLAEEDDPRFWADLHRAC